MARYQYLACDLVTGNIRESIPLVSVSAQRTLDQATPGTFSAQVPLTGLVDRETGAPNRVLQQAVIDAIDPGRSTIVVVRDGTALGEWSVDDWPDRKNDGTPISISGSYISNYFDQVVPKFSATTGDLPAAGWTATEQLTIAAALAGQAKDPIPGSLAPAGSHGLTFTIPTVTPSGVVRDRTDWPGKYETVLAMLNELCQVTNGFDWDIDVQIVGQQVVRTLNLSYPRRGIDSGIVLQPAEGRPGGNVVTLSAPETGTRVATQIIGIGTGTGTTQVVATSNNPTQAGIYPLRQKVYTDSSVLNKTTLQQLADAQAMNCRSSVLPPVVTVLASADPVLGSYRCGDYMTIVAGQSTNFPNGYSQKMRLTGFTVNPPVAGPEVVTLTLALIPES